MKKIEEYIKNEYKNNALWFIDEVNKPSNTTRIGKVRGLKNYLHGKHKTLTRQDCKFKEQEFKVKKLVLQNAKTILNFHSIYLLGNPISLTGTEELIDKLQDIYNYGSYNDVDFELLDKLVKYGDSYEYIYIDDNDNITSKVIDNSCSYPVYNEKGEYIAFIEHWSNIENKNYWIVYYEDCIQEFNDLGDKVSMVGEYKNISGLPLHYKGINDWDNTMGEGLLENVIPILDEIEDLMSKMGDAIYTLSLNPLLFTTGQAIEGNGVSNDMVGMNVALENGSSMEYVSAIMDYSTIKYYLDTLQNELNVISYMPSILGGNGNIANVSEVSLKMLYSLADVYAMLNEKVLRRGFNERFNIIRRLIGEEDRKQYVNVTFNYSRPRNASELLDNMKKQFDMNAISLQTIIEKSPLTDDVVMELKRLEQNCNVKSESDEKSK
ncbi:phage portal protein [Clostridium botulinum]|uniref:phage portal protein n=1 Tax=unclassified Clostridium TaxID=2614128 RepID=UPI0013CBFBD8|nr:MULTISPECIES: phage portal protein [unclassified Clostridium]NFN77762.1 phage portal protein [Clostridium botulinum]NFO76773.1 phage portal protein [Clostridium botulinum]NFP03135.1 phage portal protein [Clostridium botulinum]NFS00842.1 phage portal protein [Clostridium botulinum]NFT96346.1 phage portal protein [Clostridium botulinum]